MAATTSPISSMMATSQGLSAAGSLASGFAALMQGVVANEMAKADAAAERSAAAQQADRILRLTARQRGAARAATAASGARIDQFSIGVEKEIDLAGETDAALTILGGNDRADKLRNAGRLQRQAGLVRMGTSVFEADFSGWKGRRSFGPGLDAFYGGTGKSGD